MSPFKAPRSVATPTLVMSFASLGLYRLPAMSRVKAHFGRGLAIFGGDSAPDPATRLISPDQLEMHLLHNRYWRGEILIQNLPFLRFAKSQVLLLDLNPRMPQVWLLLIWRRLLHRPTVLWGHAWPRAGMQSRTDILRGTMRRLATSLIVYTRTQAEELAAKYPTITVTAAPNALYSKSEFVFDGEGKRDCFVYVGRLHMAKKPDLLLRAFELAYDRMPDLKLVIVGDGDMFVEITRMASTSRAHANIELLGFVSDYEHLRSIYSRAIASVSPGYVGLSITQSLSFGVPIIISKTEPHAPEIEAAVEGQNCEFFSTGDVRDLASRLIKFANTRRDWANRGQEITDYCCDRYSVENMVTGLIHALELELK